LPPKEFTLKFLLDIVYIDLNIMKKVAFYGRNMPEYAAKSEINKFEGDKRPVKIFSCLLPPSEMNFYS